MSEEFTSCLFSKVDVDKVRDVASELKISAMYAAYGVHAPCMVRFPGLISPPESSRSLVAHCEVALNAVCWQPLAAPTLKKRVASNRRPTFKLFRGDLELETCQGWREQHLRELLAKHALVPSKEGDVPHEVDDFTDAD